MKWVWLAVTVLSSAIGDLIAQRLRQSLLTMPMRLDFELATCGCDSRAVLHSLGTKPLPQAPI